MFKEKLCLNTICPAVTIPKWQQFQLRVGLQCGQPVDCSVVCQLRVPFTHLLWRYIKRHGTQVHLAVRVDTGHHEEDAGSLGAALQQAAQPENHSSLILLNYLRTQDHGVIFFSWETIVLAALIFQGGGREKNNSMPRT